MASFYIQKLYAYTASIQGIVFFQLQVNYIINFEGNIFIQRKDIYSQKICSFKRIIYSFKELYSFGSRKLYSLKEL